MARRSQVVPPPQKNSMVASGKQLRIDAPLDKSDRRTDAVYDDVWKFYDTLPEVWFAGNFVKNAFQQIRLIAATYDPETGDVIPIEEPNNPAVIEIDRLRGPDGTHGDLLGALSLNLDFTGRCFMVGRTDPETLIEDWGIYSIDQIIEDKRRKAIKETPESAAIALGDDDTIIELWRPHPKNKNYADSPVRSCLNTLEELSLLSQLIRSTVRSRIASNGVLLFPDEVTFSSFDPTHDSNDGNLEEDPFYNNLLEAGMTAIKDEGSAAAAFPLLARLPADMIDKVKHLTLDRAIDTLAQSLREECRKAFATGVDLPAEVLLGTAGVNHWGVWAINEQTWTAHLRARAVMIVNALTEAFLRPILPDSEEICWFDATALLADPDLSAVAVSARDRLLINDDSARTYMGLSDADAPTDDEYARMLVQDKGVLTPQITVELMKQTGQLPPEFVLTDGDTFDDTSSSDDAEDIDSVGPPAVASSAAKQGRAKRLQKAMFRINDLTLNLLHIAAEDAMAKAQSAIAAAGDEDDTDAMFAAFGSQYDSIVGRGQQQARQLLVDYGDFAEDSPEYTSAVQQHQAGLGAGKALMMGGLVAVLAAESFKPSFLGEGAPTSKVPMGISRASLQLAGGAEGEVTTSVWRGVQVPSNVLAGDGSPMGLLADSDFLMDIWAEVGITMAGHIWHWGGADKPFDPHYQLDGKPFASYDDEILAAEDPSDFPYVDYYEPNDHPGCSCETETVLSE